MWWTSGAVKTAWIWWSIIKTRTVFPSQNLFWKVKFAIKSIYLAGDIEGFFCPDYTNVVTLFMHLFEQQKKLDLSLATDVN